MDEVDRLLAEEELIPCKMKIAGAGPRDGRVRAPRRPAAPPAGVGIGHLQPGNHGADLAKGARIQAPLWLALALHKKNMVELEYPEHYNKRCRDELEAGAASVNLRLYSQHYFTVGLDLARAKGDDALRRELRAGLSGERYAKLFDWSTNSGDRDVSELTEKLTTEERALFDAGYAATNNVDTWKKRNLDQLDANPVFKKAARKAKS